MTVSVRGDGDVLDSGAPAEDRTLPAGSVVLALAAALVAGAAVVHSGQVDDVPRQAAAPVALVGRLHVDQLHARRVELDIGDVREHEALGLGRVRLELPDRQLEGEAVVEFSASSDVRGGRHVGVHTWGAIRLRLDGERCRGSFGWSNGYDPPEGGGSMHLRCEDGTTLAATMVATGQPEDGMTVDLRDGWYAAGPAPDGR